LSARLNAALGGVTGVTARVARALARGSPSRSGRGGPPSNRAERLAAIASTALGRVVAPHEVLFDAPPVQREVQIDVDIYYAKEQRYRPLAEVSPVVRTLAEEQFDDYVKRVRVFAHPRIAAELRGLPQLGQLVCAAIDRTAR